MNLHFSPSSLLPLLAIGLSACKPEPNVNPDRFSGDAALSWTGGPWAQEDAALTSAGWAQLDGDGFATYAATDDTNVHELTLILGSLTPGAADVRWVRQRYGNVHILGDGAGCVGEVFEVDASLGAEIVCEGLLPETGLNEGEGPVTLTVSLSGGALTTGLDRATLLTPDWLTLNPALVPAAGAAVDALNTERAALIPWRDGALWALFESSDDGSFDDLLMRITHAGERITVNKEPLDATQGGVSLSLTGDTEITAAVEGSGEEQTGASLTLTLWDDVQAGAEQVLVNVR
jgi:hypothetical protein